MKENILVKNNINELHNKLNWMRTKFLLQIDIN